MTILKYSITFAVFGTLSITKAFHITSSNNRLQQQQQSLPKTLCKLDTTGLNENENNHSLFLSSRREMMISSSVGLVALGGLPTTSTAADDVSGGEGVTMYKTASGLKYIELEPGQADTPSPKYGQLCVVSYTAYLKLPNQEKKEQFDSSSGYVLKHGNGRMVPGLDEGLHTMKKGGVRRLIIPPKLGFVESGLGPLPEMPWNRRKLNNLLDEMIAQKGGNLVYDIRLINFFDDEADQGYYQDDELTSEELDEIQRKLNRGNNNLPGELAAEGQV